MLEIDYSVVIRTTGKAHEKYQALLDSIDKLTPKPAEVIVVLPTGFDIPNERLGYEKYYFSPKGMVIQRMTGIKNCKTRYALVCDDDVKFGDDFVQKLHKPVYDGLGSFSAGPLYSFLPPKGVNATLSALMASAVPTLLHRKNRYVSVLKSTGYSYNRHLDLKHTKYYETQSVAWTCFFADVQSMKDIAFEDEIWLDSHGYSALDDQTMFYKAWLNGHKTIVVSDAYYEHMDARTSTRNNKEPALYSGTFNRVVFWHRFIYSTQRNFIEKGLSRIAFWYRMRCMRLWDYISVLRHHMSKEDCHIAKQGYIDGKKYIRSSEYKNMPSLYKEK